MSTVVFCEFCLHTDVFTSALPDNGLISLTSPEFFSNAINTDGADVIINIL